MRSGALLVAVRARNVSLVRLLMRHGANAHVGVYPHRDATNPLTIAAERGYEEVVAAIREEERRRQSDRSGVAEPADEFFAAIGSGDDERAIALMTATPALIEVRHAVFDVTPLLAAARRLNAPLVRWLTSHGASVDVRGGAHPADDAQRQRGDAGFTALDVAAYWSGLGADDSDTRVRFSGVAETLLQAGAAMTPRAAVALGRLDWLRARSADGTLVNRIEESGGLLRVAVSHDRADVLAFLLDAGFDPDERTGFATLAAMEWCSRGACRCGSAPRRTGTRWRGCCSPRGADPNAEVYASGSPIHRAYDRGNRQMIELLERAWRRARRQRRRILRPRRSRRAAARVTRRVGGSEHRRICCTAPPAAATRTSSARPWHGSSGAATIHDGSRSSSSRCAFPARTRRAPTATASSGASRMLVARCDPNLRGRLSEGQPFGLTLLHTVAGARPHVTREERVAFATLLLDAGARLDARDLILECTPLAWACRWGQGELVDLFLARGADPIEADAPAVGDAAGVGAEDGPRRHRGHAASSRRAVNRRAQLEITRGARLATRRSHDEHKDHDEHNAIS